MDANAVRYPTCVSDIAKVLLALCTKFASGSESIPPTLHFSAMEAMTKYDMCLVMARALRANGEEAETDHLVAEYEVDPNAATSRPRHCKLDLSVIKEINVDVECVSFEGVSGARQRNSLSKYSDVIYLLLLCAVVERVFARGA
jgi:sorting nexin-1/2